MNIFERASRSKLRFPTSKGQVSTEDLWDFSLDRLDTLAKAVNKELKSSCEQSFISEKSEADSELELSLEIVKHVIAAKIAAREAAKNRAVNAAQREQINSIIAAKKSSELASKSLEELEAMAAGLDA